MHMCPTLSSEDHFFPSGVSGREVVQGVGSFFNSKQLVGGVVFPKFVTCFVGWGIFF